MDAEYEAYLQSDAWRAKRETAKARDGHRCTMCGSSERLVVHHLTYDRIFEEDLADLVTLCDDCHQSVHAKRKAAVSDSRFMLPKKERTRTHRPLNSDEILAAMDKRSARIERRAINRSIKKAREREEEKLAEVARIEARHKWAREEIAKSYGARADGILQRAEFERKREAARLAREAAEKEQKRNEFKDALIAGLMARVRRTKGKAR